jgi:hypothetical protein
MVNEVFSLVRQSDAHRRQRAGGERQDKLRRAVEALAGDLLWNHPRLTFIPTNASEFTGQVVSHRAFVAAEEAMREVGLIKRVGSAHGFRTRGDFYEAGDTGAGHFGRDFAPRFAPMPPLLAIAERWGVLTDPRDHFDRPPRVMTRKGLVVLRAKGQGHGEGKIKGRRMPLPKGPYLERLRDELEEINTAIASVGVDGCSPPVLFRSFTLSLGDGNMPALHGRFYTPGKGGYLQMRRDARRGITVGGFGAVEVDVSASQFWCFYGAARRLGFEVHVPWERRDLYAVPGLPRPVVKAFVAATWGQGKLPEKWPRDAKTDLADQEIAIGCYPASEVREAVLQEHPILNDLDRILEAAGLDAFEGHSPSSLCSLWLMGIEAAALRIALLTLLREDGVVALPLHDALLVPEGMAELAEERLRDAFEWAAGVKPKISVKQP